MEDPGWPNARLRLRRRAAAPATPDREDEIELWLDGPRLRLRDASGRPFPDVIADVVSARGFGRSARSLEDLMGAWTPGAPRPPTEIFVDAESAEAVVVEPGAGPWRTPAASVLPLADLVLTRGRERGLSPAGEQRFLDRDCRAYHFTLDGAEDGIPFHTHVRWLVAGGYLLRRELRDAGHPGRWSTTEVIALDEGVVDDGDVRFEG
jgi:hypothetical protein